MKRKSDILKTLIIVILYSLVFTQNALADAEAPESAVNRPLYILLCGIGILVVCVTALAIIKAIRKK